MLSRHSLCSPHFGPITNGTAAHLIILSIQQHHIWIFRIIRIIKFIHVINFIKIKIKLITSGGRPQLALLLFVISLLLLLMNQGGGLLRWAGVHNWLFCYMLFGIALLLFVICYLVIALLLLLMNQGGGLLRSADVHNWLCCYLLFVIVVVIALLLLLMNQGGGLLRSADVHNWLCRCFTSKAWDPTLIQRPEAPSRGNKRPSSLFFFQYKLNIKCDKII